MACTVERLRQAARNVPVVLLLGRLKNEGLDPQIPQPSHLETSNIVGHKLKTIDVGTIGALKSSYVRRKQQQLSNSSDNALAEEFAFGECVSQGSKW